MDAVENLDNVELVDDTDEDRSRGVLVVGALAAMVVALMAVAVVVVVALALARLARDRPRRPGDVAGTSSVAGLASGHRKWKRELMSDGHTSKVGVTFE